MKTYTGKMVLISSLSLALVGCIGEEAKPTGDTLDVPAASAKKQKRKVKINEADKDTRDARKALRDAKKKKLPAPDDVAAVPSDAKVEASGLASRVLKAGTGDTRPEPTDTVKVHYSGWTTDGEMFDSSVTRGEPATFPLNRVIPGWTEGVGLMVEGESRRLWIPEEMAYKGRRGAPQGMLVFDVELLSIVRPPKAPEDVASPPSAAEYKTASGLISKQLSAGDGSEHPTAKSKVTVHYTGWTTDGKMFDSSVVRGKPASFGLGQVIPGWTEGLQLMTKGEKRRLWIPEELAYKGRPGAPQGMLVFDVELIDF